MGYRIQYGKTITKELLSEPKKGIHTSVKRTILLIVCCIVIFAISKNKDAIADFLLPGNGQTTKAAVCAFAEDLQNGEHLKEAFTAFCQEIVNNANLQD